MGGSQIDVPDRFTLTIPMFVGGGEIEIDALLRYRVSDGKLSIFYTLVRPEERVRFAFLAVRDQIALDLGRPIINGQVGA